MTLSSSLYGKPSLSDPQSSFVSPAYPTQSRETREVVPDTSQNGAPIIKIEPVAKPWAHFVAGGYEA
jgi:hypothetical protein